MNQYTLKRFVSFLLLLIFTTAVVASNDKTKKKTHLFKGGMGLMAYKNTSVLPAGLPGIVFSFFYQLKINPKPNRQFRLYTRFDYASLQKRKYSRILPYHNLDINISTAWEWKLPLKIQNLDLYCGPGLSLNGTYGYNNSPEIFQPYGNWNFSSDISTSLGYKYKQFYFSNSTRLPFLVAGHFMEYGYYPITTDDNYPSYFFEFNTLTSISKYFSIDNYLRVAWTPNSKNEKVSFHLTYLHSEKNSSINNNIVKSQKNILLFGISIKCK
jgi:hypothetical protein